MKGDGLEFVEFAEGQTKTRPGGLNAKPRQFQSQNIPDWWRDMSSCVILSVHQGKASQTRDEWSILSLDKIQQTT